MSFEGTLIFVFVTSAYPCYKREMAESRRAKSDTDIVESRRELKQLLIIRLFLKELLH